MTAPIPPLRKRTSSDALERFEAGLYEMCAICQGAQSDDHGPCVECDGKGLVLHECATEDDDA